MPRGSSWSLATVGAVAGRSRRARDVGRLLHVAAARGAARSPDRVARRQHRHWRSRRCRCGCRTSVTGRSHLVHHHTDLTDPQFDPESFYLRPVDWTSAGVGEAHVHPRDPHDGRTARRSARCTASAVSVARGPHACDPIEHAASRWLVHVVAAATLGLVAVRVVGIPVWEYVVGFVMLGPVVHPVAFVRRALRRCRRHAVGSRQGRSGDVVDVPQQQPAPHASRPAVHARGTPCRNCTARWRATRSPPRAPGCIATATSKWPERNLVRPFCQPDHPLSPGARPFGARGLR